MLNIPIATLLSTGTIPFTSAAVTADSNIGGQAFNASLPLGTTDVVAATDAWIGGLRYTQAGVLRLYDATLGAPAGAVTLGGFLASSDGQLCVRTDAIANAVFVQGIATNGGISYATITGGTGNTITTEGDVIIQTEDGQNLEQG
jgi:hypothetical protein